MTHHPASHRYRRRAAAVVAAVVCCCSAAAGCSRSADRPAPVSGQVLVKGQPAKGVTVTLHPVAAPAADGPAVFPTAQTDDAGKFTLTSNQAGDYKVTATRYEIPAPK